MRIVIIGGPRCGKSTTAGRLSRATGAPIFCADHRSKVKEPLSQVHYLPETISWYQPGPWIVGNWFTVSPPWIIEGSTLVRALRYWKDEGFPGSPCDKIILCFKPQIDELSKGQQSLLKGVMTIWQQVAHHYFIHTHTTIE